jgi:hypothetical protein
MNDYEAERIAAAINVLRPDWPVRSLITLMGREQLKHRPRRDVLVALAWVASETNSSTPARVLEAGPWWKAVAIETPNASHRQPPRLGADRECRTHVGEYADSCRGCHADQLAATDDPPPADPPDLDGLTGRERFRIARDELDLRRALNPGVTDEREDETA